MCGFSYQGNKRSPAANNNNDNDSSDGEVAPSLECPLVKRTRETIERERARKRASPGSERQALASLLQFSPPAPPKEADINLSTQDSSCRNDDPNDPRPLGERFMDIAPSDDLRPCCPPPPPPPPNKKSCAPKKKWTLPPALAAFRFEHRSRIVYEHELCPHKNVEDKEPHRVAKFIDVNGSFDAVQEEHKQFVDEEASVDGK